MSWRGGTYPTLPDRKPRLARHERRKPEDLFSIRCWPILRRQNAWRPPLLHRDALRDAGLLSACRYENWMFGLSSGATAPRQMIPLKRLSIWLAGASRLLLVPQCGVPNG